LSAKLVSGFLTAILAATLSVGAARANKYDDAIAAINNLPDTEVFQIYPPSGMILVFIDPKQPLVDAAVRICGVLRASGANDIKLVRFLDGAAHQTNNVIKILQTIPCK